MLLSVFISCKRSKDIDTEKPVIDLGSPEAFPKNCDTIYFGESFDLRVLFTDNVELGSYSIDIHHNFDRHSHSTEITECKLSPKKASENPFLYIEDFNIPDGLKEYETKQSFTIPSDNNFGIFDPGDYHITISLTDKEGWSSQKGLNIKLYYKRMKT